MDTTDEPCENRSHTLPGSESPRVPSSLLNGHCCSESICLKAGLGALGQAAIAPGSVSWGPGPSKFPAHLWSPLPPLLRARARYSGAREGPSWTPLVKVVPELGSPGVTLLCRWPHGSLSKHTDTQDCDDTKGKNTSAGHWDSECYLSASLTYPPCHTIRRISTRKKQLCKLFNWETQAQLSSSNVFLYGLIEIHIVSKEILSSHLNPRENDWIGILGGSRPRKCQGPFGCSRIFCSACI